MKIDEFFEWLKEHDYAIVKVLKQNGNYDIHNSKEVYQEFIDDILKVPTEYIPYVGGDI